MPIPKFHELFSDILEVLSSGEPIRRKEVAEKAIARKHLTDAELSERLKSGWNRAEDRAHWASAYLYYSGAIARPSRGYLQITDFGRQLLADHPHGVTLDVLERTEGLKAWGERTRAKQQNKGKADESASSSDFVSGESGASPSEQLEVAVQVMRAEVESEILSRLRSEHWSFMEKAVLKVLLKLGYGADENDLSHVGGPNDEGIDGIINQDKLGLDQIFVQSKRYKEGSDIDGNTINAFMGAMGRKGVTKGVFITASHFKESAKKAVQENKIQQVVLIDGEELAKIMVDYQIGVAEVQTYSIFKIDENFFEE